MGLYDVNCTTCGKSRQWFSGSNIICQCPITNVIPGVHPNQSIPNAINSNYLTIDPEITEKLDKILQQQSEILELLKDEE